MASSARQKQRVRLQFRDNPTFFISKIIQFGSTPADRPGRCALEVGATRQWAVPNCETSVSISANRHAPPRREFDSTGWSCPLTWEQNEPRESTVLECGLSVPPFFSLEPLCDHPPTAKATRTMTTSLANKTHPFQNPEHGGKLRAVAFHIQSFQQRGLRLLAAEARR